MSDSVYCDICGHDMLMKDSNNSDKYNSTIYCCSNCNYKYEEGFRFNKLINEFIKHIRIL